MTEQSDVYSDFIVSELKYERDRKAAMDTKATSLVTTSGSLATILAVVGTFVGNNTDSAFPSHAAPLLVLALISFVLASLAGICSGWSRPYGVADVSPMRKMIDERWMDDQTLAQVEVAAANIEMIESLRDVNRSKELFLRSGWVGQILALALLSVVVLIILATH